MSTVSDTEADVPIPRVTFTNPSGESLTAAAVPGDSVMQTAKRHGIPGIRADCGGFMMCATCHVYVAEHDLPGLPPVSEIEDEMLDGTISERLHNSRLSCQLPVDQGTDLHVTLPERQI